MSEFGKTIMKFFRWANETRSKDLGLKGWMNTCLRFVAKHYLKNI